MKKRLSFIVPLLAVGALFSCNPKNSDGFTIDSVTVNLKSNCKECKLGFSISEIDKSPIESVDVKYVKKDTKGEITEEKEEKNVSGYTVKTDLERPLDFTDVNSGSFTIDVEYKGSKGKGTVDIIRVFQEEETKTFSSGTHNIDTTNVLNPTYDDFSEITYEAYGVTEDDTVSITDSTKFIVKTGAKSGDTGCIFAFKTIDEKKTLLDGYVVKVA